MDEMFNWLINIPTYLAEFGNWLVEPIRIGSIEFTPLGAFGVSALAFVGIILTLHIIHLVNPVG